MEGKPDTWRFWFHHLGRVLITRRYGRRRSGCYRRYGQVIKLPKVSPDWCSTARRPHFTNCRSNSRNFWKTTSNVWNNWWNLWADSSDKVPLEMQYDAAEKAFFRCVQKPESNDSFLNYTSQRIWYEIGRNASIHYVAGKSSRRHKMRSHQDRCGRRWGTDDRSWNVGCRFLSRLHRWKETKAKAKDLRPQFFHCKGWKRSSWVCRHPSLELQGIQLLIPKYPSRQVDQYLALNWWYHCFQFLGAKTEGSLWLIKTMSSIQHEQSDRTFLLLVVDRNLHLTKASC